VHKPSISFVQLISGGVCPELTFFRSRRSDGGSKSIFLLLNPTDTTVQPHSEVDINLGLRFAMENRDRVSWAPVALEESHSRQFSLMPCVLGSGISFIAHFFVTARNRDNVPVTIKKNEPLVRLTIIAPSTHCPLRVVDELIAEWGSNILGQSTHKIVARGVFIDNFY
jgi:hypothetical protein